MPNYKLFKEESDYDPYMIQKPIEKISNVSQFEDQHYFYESTTTFNRKFWSLHRAIDVGIYQIVKELTKYLIFRHSELWRVDYVVEYHKDGFPHFHCQIITKEEIYPEEQQNLERKLSRKFGFTKWYQTNKKDFLHYDKVIEGKNTQIKWSEYIRKDLEKNEKNACKHGYTITSNPAIY